MLGPRWTLAARAQAHLVARESGGNPLFIDELVEHIQAGTLRGGWDTAGNIDLEAVLWARIQAQPADAQRLLEIVAVSGRPIHRSRWPSAAELGPGVALLWARCGRPARSAARRAGWT